MLVNMQIENIGKSPAAIASLLCILRQRDYSQTVPGIVMKLPIKTHMMESTSASSGPITLFIGTIHLKPGDVWQQTARAYGPQSEVDEEAAQEIDDKLAGWRAEYVRRRLENGAPEPIQVVITDEALVEEARVLARRNLGLIAGQYDLFIGALDFDGKVITCVKNTLTLSPRNIDILHEIINNYQHGAMGLSYQRRIIEPRLSPPMESQAINEEFIRLMKD